MLRLDDIELFHKGEEGFELNVHDLDQLAPIDIKKLHKEFHREEPRDDENTKEFQEKDELIHDYYQQATGDSL